MQYNKGTRAEVLTRRRSAREGTGALACVTSFGLSSGGGGGGRKTWCGCRAETGRIDIFRDIATFWHATRAAIAQQIDDMKSAPCF